MEREHVTTVVMEATSDYWKPFYCLRNTGASLSVASR
ncbi:hypothetical protein J2W15_001880 [Pseudarthrobacter sulfonivorans]|nr:hypothetical protein [Pseudarthrobacter sulfonivorans]